MERLRARRRLGAQADRGPREGILGGKALGADDIIDPSSTRVDAKFLSTRAVWRRQRTVPRSVAARRRRQRTHGHRVQGSGEKKKLMTDIFALAMELGGAISGEHGVGRAKTGYFLELEDPVKISLMRVSSRASIRRASSTQALSSETPEHGQEPAGPRPVIGRPTGLQVSSATSSWTARSAGRQSRFPRICPVSPMQRRSPLFIRRLPVASRHDVAC